MKHSNWRDETVSVVSIVLTVALLAPATVHAASMTVREPAFGLPHIYADTEAELARENGREIAKDRLGQILLLARVGRGTLYQVFGALDPSTLNDDIEARQTAYTSSELNTMFTNFPAREQTLLMEYCRGVNDTIEAVYTGSSPQPIEITVVRSLGLSNDLFGNATNISDQVDPNYKAPGGADPDHPNAGFQFTPELAVAIGILEVRNFGLGGFDEEALYDELQALIGKFGMTSGSQIWDDRNFLNDPLAPVSVPDSTTPGFGGPLAAKHAPTMLAAAAARYPRYRYADGLRRRRERQEERAQFAQRLGAWPKLGSYAWMIGGGKSATGYPWIGGFPQTGIQTPSIMHFAENRSAEGTDHRIQGVGMEFAGAPLILIGETDSVAYTTTTAQLRVVDTFFESIVNESTDSVRFNDEGSPAPLSKRTETFRGSPAATRIFWRSHARGGNNGSRPIVDFRGDAEGPVSSATSTSLTASSVSFGSAYNNGYVLITDGTGAGQIRNISSATTNTLTLASAWTTVPNTTSVFVAVKPGDTIIAVSIDSAAWMEESTAVLGFSMYQRAQSVLDIRAGVRLIPTTHNFFAGDNQPFNSIGTASGTGGNIGYFSSGFSRVRQGDLDSRLPMDGTAANPLVVFRGTVAGASATTMQANTSVFGSADLSPPAYNYRYLHPTQLGSEYIVAITSGTGYKQTRRIASNTADTLTVESAWGLQPTAGSTFEVYEIIAMPEAINPSEQYTANWNNKAATADEGDDFGRQFRHIDILERLANENSWDRAKQRQLNKDVAGLDGKGRFGRFLIPRLRQAVDAVGNGGNSAVDTVLTALEAHNNAPFLGRFFIDPVTDTMVKGEVTFLNNLVNQLAADIYGDEYAGAVSTPTGSKGLNLAQHAIDSAAGDLPEGYAQAYAGDYFNGTGWQTKVRDSLSTLASGGIPADSARPVSHYRHPLYDAFVGLGNMTSAAMLDFAPTPQGNRGTYEQIIEVGPGAPKGEFIFPLGQSGLITGSLGGVTSIDPNVTSLHTIWRDWRFVPMLRVSSDLQSSGTADTDGDGIFDGYERWYYGNLDQSAKSDTDKDRSKLLNEFLAGTDPTVVDTDGDGIVDGRDTLGQDRLRSGVLALGGRVKFGIAPPGDDLKLAVTLGAGSPEFDPATRDLTLTLTDDDQFYTVTIPAGTFVPNAKNTIYKYDDPAGTLAGITQARFRKGGPKGKDRLVIKTMPMNLSAANFNTHVVTTQIVFGAQSMTDTRCWDLDGLRLHPVKQLPPCGP